MLLTAPSTAIYDPKNSGQIAMMSPDPKYRVPLNWLAAVFGERKKVAASLMRASRPGRSSRPTGEQTGQKIYIYLSF